MKVSIQALLILLTKYNNLIQRITKAFEKMPTVPIQNISTEIWNEVFCLF